MNPFWCPIYSREKKCYLANNNLENISLENTHGKNCLLEKGVFSAFNEELSPYPTTPPPNNTHPRIHHIQAQENPTKTVSDLICKKKSPDIWKFRRLDLSTKITSVLAKVVIRIGKQIFLCQITMFLRRNIPNILGCHGKQNCFIAQILDKVLDDILKII